MDLPDSRLTEIGKQQEAAEADKGNLMEVIEDKQDEIERLKDELEKQRLKLIESQKQVADLSEAIQIAEERTANAISEREKFSEKNKDYIYRMQSIKDEL